MPPWMNTGKQPCGTSAAARRHHRNNEPLCRACREAEIQRWRKQNKPKRSRATTREPTGWQPGFVVDVLAVLDICEAIEGPDPEWYRERALETGP
jgi:hypothetical protein